MLQMRKIRKQRNMTMRELGAAVGVSESSISLYETGKNEPDIQTISKIADVLGVSIDTLLGHEESVPEDEVMALRDQLRRDPNTRLLFDAARNANPEHIRAAAEMLKALRPMEGE